MLPSSFALIKLKSAFMLTDWYARWMYAWETRLTTRDENRVVRPLEWGFEWVAPFLEAHGFAAAVPGPDVERDHAAAEAAMVRINSSSSATATSSSATSAPPISASKSATRSSSPPTCALKRSPKTRHSSSRPPKASCPSAQFLRFTSPERTPYPENDLVNARWYPAPAHKDPARPKQAIIVMPQWNADGFSHNSLCTLFNRMGVSALRLSKPYHDIRRPAELERSDYAVSANIGRTISACRQAVVDIRCCLDWLEEQGYEHFGVLGTSLGSCYAFLASAHDPRLRVNAFNHASTAFGDVVWAGQSTRHIRQAVEEAGLTQERLRALWAAVSPVSYYEQFARRRSRRRRQKRAASSTPTTTSPFPGSTRSRWSRHSAAHGVNYEVARAALRPLHHRRNALQIHRRLVHGLVRLSRLQSAARRESARALHGCGAATREVEEEARFALAHVAQIHPQQLRRIEIRILPAHRPVQMRPGHAARCSAQSEQLALASRAGLRAHRCGSGASRSCNSPKPVVDDHAVAFVVERPRQHHHAAVAGAHRRSRRARKSIPL